MKITSHKILIFAILFLCSLSAYTQYNSIDSLNAILQKQKEDSLKVNVLLKLSKTYLEISSPDTVIIYASQAKMLAEKIKFLRGKGYALKYIGLGRYYQGKLLEAREYWNESLQIFENLKDDIGVANLLNNISAVYSDHGNDEKALEYSLRSLEISEKTGDKLRILSALNGVGSIYYNKQATYDKALAYFLQALPLAEEVGGKDAVGVIYSNVADIYFFQNDLTKALVNYEKSVKSFGDLPNSSYSLNGIGNVYLKKGDFKLSLDYHKKALVIAEKSESKQHMYRSFAGIASVYIEEKDYVNALVYFKKAIALAEEIKATPDLKGIYQDMAQAYSKNADYKNAFKYQTLYASIKDTLYNIESNKKLGKLQFVFDGQKHDDSLFFEKNKEIQKLGFDKITSQNKFRFYLLLGGFTIMLIIAGFLFRNNRQKQKVNSILFEQKQQIESTLSELKSTQSQLIQSEKMASLGALTAGIAHEIQNPLNFVNNFSEVNNELIEEMSEEIKKGNSEEARNIAGDIKENNAKITHHGNRANEIVKGMLQHSKSSSGNKELTDINKLSDEYLRLSYHGIKAKDNSFNVTLKTDFDEAIDKINIIPQGIARVLLNLYNNAFYAVNERSKQQNHGYEPAVSVSTIRLNGKVEIHVKDNGNGIPQKVIDKIYQPFFTTKPTGQGTGLGLSLSYDIVKAHGGEINVNTKDGEFTEFVVTLTAL